MIWNTCLSMSLVVGATYSIIMLGNWSYFVENIAQLHSRGQKNNNNKKARRNLVHGAKIDCQYFRWPCTATNGLSNGLANGLANGSYTQRIVKARK